LLKIWEKKYPPKLFDILVFIFWNSKIGKVGQNGPKNSFEKVILKCFFKKRQKNRGFSFLRIFVYFIGSRRQLSKGKSFLQKSEKLFQRDWRAQDGTFCRKMMFFYKIKCKNSGVFFKKQRKKHFFLQLPCRVYLKQLNKKVTRKKRVFCCFFPTFCRFSLLRSILKVLFWVFFWCSDIITSWILIQNLSETLKIEQKLGIFFKNQRFWTFFHTFCGIF